MDDPQNIPEAGPPEEASAPRAPLDLHPDVRPDAQPAAEMPAELVSSREPAWTGPPSVISLEDVASHRRSFRHNLLVLLSECSVDRPYKLAAWRGARRAVLSILPLGLAFFKQRAQAFL